MRLVTVQKPQSVPSKGYEFLREQHHVCAVASPDGQWVCIKDVDHDGPHGDERWGDTNQHSELGNLILDGIYASDDDNARKDAAQVAVARLEEQLESTQKALNDACDVAIWLSALIGGVVDGDSPEVHTTWQESMRPKLFAALDLVSNPATQPPPTT